MAAPSTIAGARNDAVSARPEVLGIRWVHPTESAPPVPCREGTQRLGRGESCEHVLHGAAVSREHAELTTEGSRALLRDKHSRNGVFVDGARVAEATLASGQVVRIGDWVGLVEPLEPTRAHGVLHEIASGFHVGSALRTCIDAARRVAESEAPVALEGETGTGKERVARAIHEWSRARGPFVAINCAALLPSLVEAELFGHRQGAVSGAIGSGEGAFRSARGGTLLLDEVVELPLAAQARLLRVLERREIVPVGETRAVPIDVRVVVTGQTPLSAGAREGSLRADLLTAFEPHTLRVPPLRERRLEAVPLFRKLLADRTGNAPPDLDPRFVECLSLHDWPFNVREVELLARKLLVRHGQEPLLRRSFLPERMRLRVPIDRTPAPNDSPAAALDAFGVDENERELTMLTLALRANDGSVARASAQIGISRQRAYGLMGWPPDGDWVGVRRSRG